MNDLHEIVKWTQGCFWMLVFIYLAFMVHMGKHWGD